MRILDAKFEKTIFNILDRPKVSYPEVCFIGRSNVGKSSLINTLLMRKIARTSSTPGATKAVNLYKVDFEHRGKRKTAFFSDFPGFGFTKVPRSLYHLWEKLIDSYVKSNNYIRRLIWVFDVRRDFDELDNLTLNWIRQCNLEFSFVLTKADKISKDKAEKKNMEAQKLFGDTPIFLFSSKERFGRRELLSHILDILCES